MLGEYEQVPRFGFIRKKVFKVCEAGIKFRGKLHEWPQIREFHSIRGIGWINFIDGTKCRIHMNSFRKIGERGHLSLFGSNPTFSDLAGYWYGKKLDSLKPVEMNDIESEIEELTNSLDSATATEEINRIAIKLKRASRKHLDLKVTHLKALDGEYLKLRRKDRILTTVIVLSLLVAIAAMTLTP